MSAYFDAGFWAAAFDMMLLAQAVNLADTPPARMAEVTRSLGNRGAREVLPVLRQVHEASANPGHHLRPLLAMLRELEAEERRNVATYDREHRPVSS